MLAALSVKTATTLSLPTSLITSSNFSEIYSAVCDVSLVSNAFQNNGFGKVTMKLIIDSLRLFVQPSLVIQIYFDFSISLLLLSVISLYLSFNNLLVSTFLVGNS